MACGLSYKRILLKLSGESLMGGEGFGLSREAVRYMADELSSAAETGVELGIVIGGGNIFRGAQIEGIGIPRVTADHMGMLATVMNALTLQAALELRGIESRVMSGLEVRGVVEPFIQRTALEHLANKRVIIFAAGTGNPYFTTDTAAALRALEIGAEVIFKATKVDGIYSDDPVKNPSAERYENISYIEVLNKGLAVMDSTAITLCMDNNISIVIFDMMKPGGIKRAIMGERIGSFIGGR